MLWNAQESDGMPYETLLKVGALYFVTTNIDVSDGLFNGALGFLRRIDFGINLTGVSIPKVAWLEFESPVIGVDQRAKSRSKYQHLNLPATWVPIERVSKSLSKSHVYPGLELVRKQIPIVGANGMTIAKSQGSSMPLVVVSMRKKLSREHLYVACSRATSRNGLFIDGEFTPPSHPGIHDDVSNEMQTLRKTPVDFELRFFADVISKNKLYYHNIETFRKYQQDVICDPHIMSSNMLAFVEPHLSALDEVEIPGFTCVFRKNCHRKNSEGMLFYHKNGQLFNILRKCFVIFLIKSFGFLAY